MPPVMKAFTKLLPAPAASWTDVEVVGNWAPGDAQKVTADAIAAGGDFDGIYVQGGSHGVGDRHARCWQVRRANVG